MTNLFPSNIASASINAEKETTIPASCTMVQWAIESAWGKHVIGKFNYFGIKYRKGVNGLLPIRVMTNEYLMGKDGKKHWIEEEQEFQDYAALEQAFSEHGKLIQHGSPYKEAMMYLHMGEYSAFVSEMARHYATGPQYAHVILSLVAKYTLWEYDVNKLKGYPMLSPQPRAPSGHPG